MNSRAVTQAAVIGTVLQLVMVICGHFVPAIANLFAFVGVSISLIAGIIYVKAAGRATTASHALGGFIAGGLCALIGIAVSYFLGDVEMMILAAGTGSSAVTGAIGGVIGHYLFGNAPSAASA
jgi:hypothetical protein